MRAAWPRASSAGRATAARPSAAARRCRTRAGRAITGVLAKVLDSSSRKLVGGPDNDELLGHHGSDTIVGGDGKDVLWGDWDPSTTTRASATSCAAGRATTSSTPATARRGSTPAPATTTSGRSTARARSTAAPGRGDVARIRENGAFKTRNCERIQHFCQFGSKPNGDCKKPGEVWACGRRAARALESLSGARGQRRRGEVSERPGGRASAAQPSRASSSSSRW